MLHLLAYFFFALGSLSGWQHQYSFVKQECCLGRVSACARRHVVVPDYISVTTLGFARHFQTRRILQTHVDHLRTPAVCRCLHSDAGLIRMPDGPAGWACDNIDSQTLAFDSNAAASDGVQVLCEINSVHCFDSYHHNCKRWDICSREKLGGTMVDEEQIDRCPEGPETAGLSRSA